MKNFFLAVAFLGLAACAQNHDSSHHRGGSGWTSRVDIYTSGGGQLFTWKVQPGYLANNLDLTNLEFTAYVRVYNIVDSARAQIALIIRGGRHTSSNPDLASCTV